MITGKIYLGLFIVGSAFLLIVSTGLAQSPQDSLALENRVHKFLAKHKGTWHDMNVPEVDGQLLHDIILRNNYTSALEIGTSTGHSGIWLALALSKTGGKLITIEIDEDRYQEVFDKF